MITTFLQWAKLDSVIVYPEKAYIIFRFLFGIYFVYYFVRSFPYVVSVYSNEGMLRFFEFNWTYGMFPNFLYVFDSPIVVTATIFVGIVFAVLFSLGFVPRVSAFFLWYIQTALFNRNNLTGDPSIAYVGLLLLILALLPQVRPLTKYFLSKKDIAKEIVVPFYVFYVPVFIFCLTFTMSALDKVNAVSWRNGEAFRLILNLPIAKEWFLVSYLRESVYITPLLSYLALVAQFICLPLFILGWYRVALVINLFSFIFVYMTLELNQVSVGMIFFFVFFLLRDFNGKLT